MLRDNQYGGEPGVSTTHMLVEIWRKITQDLEDNRAISVITAIDYSKAFNRLEHLPCLEALARKGASNQIIGLIADFLHHRKMTVRVGSEMSSQRCVNAGAPQGSVLGSFLFNVGTDDLDVGDPPPISTGSPPPVETRPDHPRGTSSPVREAGLPFVHCTDSPICRPPTQPGDFEIEFLPQAVNVPPRLRRPPKWEDRPLSVVKYIDDAILLEKVNVQKEPLLELSLIHI